jgi:osmotically-inducible protein OsmY
VGWSAAELYGVRFGKTKLSPTLRRGQVRLPNASIPAEQGTVTLTGTVGSILARNKAESIARDTDGVRAVNNQIVVEDRSK